MCEKASVDSKEAALVIQEGKKSTQWMTSHYSRQEFSSLCQKFQLICIS